MPWIPLDLFVPHYTHWANSDGNGSTIDLDATTTRLAYLLQAPKSGVLELAEFDLSAVVSAQDLRVSFQDVDLTNGNPDGTVDQFNTIASASLAASWMVSGPITDDGTAGGTRRTVTQGDYLAVVFDWPGTAGDVTFVTNFIYANLGATLGLNFPYMTRFPGVWAKETSGRHPRLALQYSDGTYDFIPHAYPMDSNTAVTFNVNSTPDERGVQFQLPTGMRVSGVWLMVDGSADYDVVLYDAADAELASASVDLDVDLGLTSNRIRFVTFPSLVELSADTTYRLTVRALSVATSVRTFYATLANVNHRQAWGVPSTWIYTSRTDGGAWTDTTTDQFIGGLTVRQIFVNPPESADLFWQTPHVDVGVSPSP